EQLHVPADGRIRPHSSTLRALQSVVHRGLATIRTEFGRFGRQVSGYALENLLPERGFNVPRFLVGTEGTLAVTTEATVRLVSDPPHRTMVVLGYPDIASAGDDILSVLSCQPSACEAIDSRIVDVVRRSRGVIAVPPLPRGAAWMFVELTSTSLTQLRDNTIHLVSSCGAVDHEIVADPRQAARLWRIREDGAGLSGRSPAGLPAYAGWEDAAVPPPKLGSYLRDFEALMADFGVTGLPYGHFGDGCLHIRLDFPLTDGRHRNDFRQFLLAASRLVATYGGSLSGEHGDGRARSELLPAMYSPAALSLFRAVKHTFDADNLLNPGVIVDPRPVDADLRVPAAATLRTNLGFSYRHDGGDFTQALHRCTGVGKCRADNTGTGGVMCPSYQATKEEKDSTRGRARVLQEMLNGATVNRGWRSGELLDVLDLCLSCKGCASDCPTGVDMALFKSEVQYQRYRHRIRPASHYSLGWLPRWARIGAAMPRLANAAMTLPGAASALLTIAGVDRRRHIPAFANETFRHWFARTATTRPQTGRPAVVFVDTFTNYFSPHVGIATVAVLEQAGFRPVLSPRQQCCGLTWISTGQLDTARAKLGRAVSQLAAAASRTPIVGIEPSCTAVLRSDAAELLEGSAAAIASRVHTLAEILTEAQWTPPPLTGHTVIAQPHCHHHAVLGYDADAQLLGSAGATIHRLGGCCGLAGNFGMEKGHYDISVAVAEQQLLPAIRSVAADTTILADGYSCRTQLADLSHRRGQHLAELLANPPPLSSPSI
ncbi:MAG: 4Fe-4S dicluster domain-containing protein, partial [Mycobacterium sp.]|nr:4Fe-4S dicluster domain-containing protein [Mycobacterium sp.]